MGLTITLNEGEAGGMWTADRRLWLTRDGEVVEDGDGRAAFLYATEGYPVPIEEARNRGLLEPQPEPEPEKQAPKPKDKMARRPRDKAPAPAEDPKQTTDQETETTP